MRAAERDTNDRFMLELLRLGAIETVPHATFRQPVGYYVTRPGDWLVLDPEGNRVGRAWSSKAAALVSIEANKGQLVRPGVYRTTDGHTIGLRRELESEGGLAA